MTAAKKRRRAKKLASEATVPDTITVDRGWLLERIEWLDVDRFAIGIFREVHNIFGDYVSALSVASKIQLTPEYAEQFKEQAYEHEHKLFDQLQMLLESVENATTDLNDLFRPEVAK